MNCTEFSRSPGVGWPSIIAATLAVALSPITTEASFEEGDSVTVTRSVPLHFREEPLRTAKQGEVFRVLAHRDKRVFLMEKSKDGKSIAIWVPEDSIALVLGDIQKLQKDAIAAVRAGNLDQASAILARAPRADRARPQIVALQKAVTDLMVAKQRMTASKAALAQVTAAADRLRKNAANVDRPNPLSPNDTSNQVRAAQMRKEADQMDSAAREAVSTSEQQHRSLLAAIDNAAATSLVAPGPAPTAAPGPRIAPVPGRELTKKEQEQMVVQRAHEAAASEAMEIASGKRWGELQCNTDRFIEVVPPNPLVGPSYQETLAFINAKLAPYKELGYGEKSRKMIVRSLQAEGDGEGETILFNPADLNAKVRYETESRQFNYEVVERGRILLEAFNGQPLLTAYEVRSTPDGVFSTQATPRSQCVLSITGTLSSMDAQRLAKAFAHLILMFGGKGEAF